MKDAAGATSAAPTYFAPKITPTEYGDTLHDIDGGIYANSPTLMAIGACASPGTRVKLDEIIIISIGTGRFEDNPIEPVPVDETISPGIGLITGFAICLGAMAFATPWITGPICFLSSLGGVGLEFYNAKSGYGQLGWLLSHGLIDSAMKWAENSDSITSSFLAKTIRINPGFDREFMSMDDSSLRHLERFDRAIDRFIETQDQGEIWKQLVGCLEGRNFNSIECNATREKTFSQFGEIYRHSVEHLAGDAKVDWHDNVVVV